ncbi:MAG: metal ABC transporter permease, partial [bacterium]
MSEFIDAVAGYPFMRSALLVGLLASVACGIIGTYVVVRRITYIAGGISHCVLGGMGAANYLNKVHGWDRLQPLHGALAAALAAAAIIGVVSLRAKQREDTVIGALWAVGMAVGVLFISRTPGYSGDLMSYLFGNILMVSPADLWLIAVLDAVV